MQGALDYPVVTSRNCGGRFRVFRSTDLTRSLNDAYSGPQRDSSSGQDPGRAVRISDVPPPAVADKFAFFNARKHPDGTKCHSQLELQRHRHIPRTQ